jgi:hypothetical protein
MINRLLLISLGIALLSACGGKKQVQQEKPHHVMVAKPKPAKKEIDKEIGKEVDIDEDDLMDIDEDEFAQQHHVIPVQRTNSTQQDQPYVVYKEITVVTDGDISNLDPIYTIIDNE